MQITKTGNHIKHNWIIRLLQIVILITIFSQIEEVETVFRPLMYGAWIMLFAFSVIYRKGRVYFSRFTVIFIVVYLLFFLYCAICGMFGADHLQNGYLRALLVPLIVVIAADEISSAFDLDNLLLVLKTYILGAALFAVWIHVHFFFSFSAWMEAQSYLFAQKNSAAQIWGSAILLTAFFIRPKSKIGKVFWVAIGAYLLFVLGLSQCRTAMLALVISVVLYFLFVGKHKIIWAGVLVALIIVVARVPIAHQFVEKALMLNRYEDANIDRFSSGRITLYKEAFQAFKQSPVIGQGDWYVDNSYLMILTGSGMIGFILIEIIWIRRAIENFFGEAIDRRGHIFLIFITIFYFVESFLEGYPPFGPGVASFMFWMLSIVLTRSGNKLIPKQQNI